MNLREAFLQAPPIKDCGGIIYFWKSKQGNWAFGGQRCDNGVNKASEAVKILKIVIREGFKDNDEFLPDTWMELVFGSYGTNTRWVDYIRVDEHPHDGREMEFDVGKSTETYWDIAMEVNNVGRSDYIRRLQHIVGCEVFVLGQYTAYVTSVDSKGYVNLDNGPVPLNKDEVAFYDSKGRKCSYDTWMIREHGLIEVL